MRQLRYSVAASLDGYIAGPDGDFDWIVVDPEIDFAAMYAGFSGLVMGRQLLRSLVATAALAAARTPDLRLLAQLPEGSAKASPSPATPCPRARAEGCIDGKPLWLWGGGELFRELPAPGWSTASTSPSSRSC